MPVVDGQMNANTTGSGAGLMRAVINGAAGHMLLNDESVATAGLMRVIFAGSGAGLMRATPQG